MSPLVARHSPGSPSEAEPPEGEIPVVVQAGASFEGLLTCTRSSRIEGRFRGNVVARDRLEVGQSADVAGRIEARNIVVAGRFEGELVASHGIALLATARVSGEFSARELVAEEGCAVTGRCRTGSAANAAARQAS